MRFRSVLGVAVFIAICGSAVVLAADRRSSGKPAAGKVAFSRAILPLLKKYCAGCHGGAKPVAEVSLDRIRSETDVLKARALFEKVSKVVGVGYMPPKAASQPTREERDRLVSWIETRLSTVDCNLSDPGRVTLRRLNRAEYNNTIRDLVGIQFRPADDFPSDDVGYGFDNIGDVLSVSPLLLEKYVAAAEHVAAKAIVTPESDQGEVRRYEAEQVPETGGEGVVRGAFRTLYGAGEVNVDHAFPVEGEYLLRARAYGEQAGEEPARMSFRLDGKELQAFAVAAVQESPALHETRARIAAGKHRFSAAFINDFYQPQGFGRNRDRNLVVDYLEIVGPLNSGPKTLPESHRRIFIAAPVGENHRDAARAILQQFARRAYRRPPAPPEVERLLRIYDYARKEGDGFERGVQLAVQAVLVSPHFLFRVEAEPGPGAPPAGAAPGRAGTGDARALNPHELAARLSYFLWSSMPDDGLFALADQGVLGDPKVLAAQVRRMLRDPKSRALVDNFAAQWLQTRNLKSLSPDPARFPAWDESLRSAMQTETELCFEHVMREDRTILEFLDAEYTWLNERLARHYGIDAVKGEEFRRVRLKGDRRGGVLTQASILTITSNPTRTSPVKRGKWVLEQILGTPPPEPPPNVPELKEEGQMLTGTLRQRMEQHRSDPGCATCHQSMDPLGFGLENFDAIGAWREKEGEFPIDASGDLPDGRKFNGPAGLKKVLKDQKGQFARNLAQQMLTYALGRGLEPYDRCAVDKILGDLRKNGYRFSTLVTGIVRSEPFLKRRGDLPEAE